jgi:hypothetical protein
MNDNVIFDDNVNYDELEQNTYDDASIYLITTCFLVSL